MKYLTQCFQRPQLAISLTHFCIDCRRGFTPRLLWGLSIVLFISVPLNADNSSIRAGAATSNITPYLGTLLDGTISINGAALEIHDELHARCLVLDDENLRLAIVVCDNTMIDRSVMDRAKRLIEERCGLPSNRVLISATHSHAAPRVVPGLHSNSLNHDYESFLVRRIADAVQQAIANLAPAKVGWTQFDKPEFVHNRRWFMKEGSTMGNPFGKSGDQVKMNARGDGLVKPAGPVDPEVFVLSVQHLDGRPLALLANYGTHYVGGYERGHISADYFGRFSKRLETLLGSDDSKGKSPPFVAMMSNGTSGDVRSSDLRKSNPTMPWEQMNVVAESIAQDVIRLYPDIKYQVNASLAMEERELSLGVRKPSRKQIAWAREVWEDYEKNPNQKFGGSSNPQVFARETLALAEYPDRKEIILQAIRIGDLSIVSSPCETFAETGLAIKRRSPFEYTFTIELANGADGYLPTFEQHGFGGYETWPARSSFLEITAERKIRSTLLEMLKQLKDGR